MSWIVLVLAGIAESVWAIALARSEGFTKVIPVLVFVVALAASMAGLAFAMRSLPTGTAYAVWVGVGATLTVGYGMLGGTEPVSPWRLVFLAMIVGGVVGLRAVD